MNETFKPQFKRKYECIYLESWANGPIFAINRGYFVTLDLIWGP